MKEKINLILALFASLLVCSIFLPVHISGGINKVSYTGTTTIFNYFFTHEDMCINCFNYSIVIWILILEFIISFLVFYKILQVIDERKR